jgi:hypothetical protein
MIMMMSSDIAYREKDVVTGGRHSGSTGGACAASSFQQKKMDRQIDG